MNHEFVLHERQNALDPLLLLEKGGLQIDQAGIKYPLDLRLRFVKRRLVVSIDGHVEPDVKELLFCLLELVAQIFEVAVCSFKLRVAQSRACSSGSAPQQPSFGSS